MKTLSKFQLNLLLKELVESLDIKFKDNFTGLILFGSYAKNTQKGNSDLDILLTFKHLPNSRLKRLSLVEDIINKLEVDYKLPINPILAQEDLLGRTFLLAEISDYSKIIIDKNNRIKNHFKKLKEEYKNGTIQKLFVGNHYMLKIDNL